MLEKKIKIRLPFILIGALVLLIITYISFDNGKKSNLNKLVSQKAQVEANFIIDKDSDLIKEIDSLNSDCEALDKQISDKSSTKAALDKYESDKKTYNENISSQNVAIKTLDSNINSKESELANLTSGMIKTGNSITLSAGNHTVGTDIPAGRYNVTGNRNFIVYSSSGYVKVNTILGGGSWGVDSYTCNLSDGDIIEASGKDTFQPVK